VQHDPPGRIFSRMDFLINVSGNCIRDWGGVFFERRQRGGGTQEPPGALGGDAAVRREMGRVAVRGTAVATRGCIPPPRLRNEYWEF
jgi:hypothetical protein